MSPVLGVSFRKKSIIYGGFFSFFGCGLELGFVPVCRGWRGWGVVLCWGGCWLGSGLLCRGLGLCWCIIVPWWACGGGPVFHPSSLKFGARLKKTGRVGIEAVSIFGHPPPMCVYCAVAGVVGLWAGLVSSMQMS